VPSRGGVLEALAQGGADNRARIINTSSVSGIYGPPGQTN
jgi:NAD(P)-dependent dehydrogenase (short-subunit alcohol dehydrogenase family)